MTNVVYIEDYRKRQFARIRAEWDELMRRAEELGSAGKDAASKALIDKAKVARGKMTKLSGPVKPHPADVIISVPINNTDVSTWSRSHKRGLQLPEGHINIMAVLVPPSKDPNPPEDDTPEDDTPKDDTPKDDTPKDA